MLNAITGKYSIENLAFELLNINVQDFKQEERKEQLNLFDSMDTEADTQDNSSSIYAFCIYNLYTKLIDKMAESNTLNLFNNIEMPLVEVLADMQYVGMYVDKQELIEYGDILQKNLEELTTAIYDLVGTEFNINSPKQLGEVLFEKIELPVIKKSKNGYSTDADSLEKLKDKHPVIEKILEYRGVAKLKSTFVDGLIPYIDKNGRIHSYFHQTVTQTGRISSTEPNLQNIPTRQELGRKLREVFKPQGNSIFIDGDYSQIELRVLAHISNDRAMIGAFNNNEDIHKQAASKVFNVPIKQVTSDLRDKAKAVNFGIVYGISDFGLGEQIGVGRRIAKEYIEEYLKKYRGIKKFMNDIVDNARQKGYVETLFNRKREIPELKSTSYMVRQFGTRIAMNTPIQGTAADIMKIAMINVYKEFNKQGLKSKLILQVHDELLIETDIDEKEKIEEILKAGMENVIELKVPLIVDISEGNNWLEAK